MWIYCLVNQKGCERSDTSEETYDPATRNDCQNETGFGPETCYWLICLFHDMAPFSKMGQSFYTDLFHPVKNKDSGMVKFNKKSGELFDL